MPYQSLDPGKLIATGSKLSRRIEERFPETGLSAVCGELVGLAEKAREATDLLTKPMIALRFMSGLLAGVIFAGIGVMIFALSTPEGGFTLPEFIQTLEAGINDMVLIGLGIFFLASLERRLKRRKVLAATRPVRVRGRPAVILAFAGLGVLAGGASAQQFQFPSGLTFAPDGSLVMADRAAHYVFRIDPLSGETRVIAGTGESGFSGDGGPAMRAMLSAPEWIEFDPDGNLILADRANHRIRRIDASTGVIATIAGTGVYESTGDGGPATRAAITNPFGLEFDSAGNLFLWDTEAHRIRRIDADTGIITTVIGTGEQGFSGDGGPGTRATMFRPHNGRFDTSGRLVFGDSFNQRIRRWDPDTGVIETIAGRGEQGSSPAGADARTASFMYFGAMAFAPDGDLVFTSLDARILRIDADTWTLSVVAGTGEGGFSGDGGPATRAMIQTPYGLAIAPDGDLYFSDASNGRVRVIDADTGFIRTLSTGVIP